VHYRVDLESNSFLLKKLSVAFFLEWKDLIIYIYAYNVYNRGCALQNKTLNVMVYQEIFDLSYLLV